MEERNMTRQENIISTKKISQNIKKYWWICLLCLLAYLAVLGVDIWRTYQADVAAASRDTYQASGMVYYPHEDEEEGKYFVTLCTTDRVLDLVNETLTSQGYAEYGAGGDSLNINWQGNTFGLTLYGEGEARMECMMDAFLSAWLSQAEEISAKSGSVLNETTVVPCLIKSNGAVVTYSNPSERKATLALSDIVTWRRLMVSAAAVFAGAIVIFIVIIFDKKIRTEEEIREVLDIPYICTVKAGEEKSEALLYAFLQGICHKENRHHIGLVCLQSEEVTGHINHQMDEIQLEILPGGCDTAEAVQKGTQMDGIVLALRLNRDRLDEAVRAADRIRLLGIPFLGYILME